MQKIGIIAAGEERPWRRKRWYEFWKQQKDYDFISHEEQQVESVIVYLPNEGKSLSGISRERLGGWLDNAGGFFEEQGVRHVACTRIVRESLGNDIQVGGVKVHDGLGLLKKMAPNILRQVAKANGVLGGSLAYVDDKLNGENDTMLEKMCRQCRYITIISDDRSGAVRLAAKLYDELGLVADVKTSGDGYVDCDFVVMVGGEIPKIPRRAIVVDVSGGQAACENELQVDWVSVNAKELRLPYDVDSLELAELLAEAGECREFKITKLYYKGKRVKFH